MSTDNTSFRSYYALCPLYSFDYDCESIDLDEGIQIKPAPSEFKERFDESYIVSTEQWAEPRAFDWVVSLPYHHKPVELCGADNIQNAFTEWEKVINLLIDFVTACRLHHEGSITPGPLKSASLHSTRLFPIGYQCWANISRNGWNAEPKYKFQQSDITGVNRLLRTLVKLREVKKLDCIDIALRRFNSSYYEDIVDRLIDQMIAFEFLYLGKEQELKYRLALRVAFLLGKDDEGKRKNIFNKMSKAYKLRSDIVHGNKEVNQFELEEIIHNTEEYLRQSIRRFSFLLSKEHPLNLKELREGTEKILPKLEENILSNGTLLASNDPSEE